MLQRVPATLTRTASPSLHTLASGLSHASVARRRPAPHPSLHPALCRPSPCCPLAVARFPPTLPSGRNHEWRLEPVAVPRRAAHREPRRGGRRVAFPRPSTAACRDVQCCSTPVVIALPSLVVKYRHRQAAPATATATEATKPPTRLPPTHRRRFLSGLSGYQCQCLWYLCFAFHLTSRPPIPLAIG